MIKSDTISSIAAALHSAQATMGKAKKDGDNPHFKSKFSTLDSIIEVLREPFSQHGLSFTQPVDISEGQGVVVETYILHSSGEYLGSKLFVPVAKWDAQGIGSAISYAKRYGLMAMAGIPSADDDGEAAVGRGPGKPVSATAKADDPKSGNGKPPAPPAAPPKPTMSQADLDGQFESFQKRMDGFQAMKEMAAFWSEYSKRNRADLGDAEFARYTAYKDVAKDRLTPPKQQAA